MAYSEIIVEKIGNICRILHNRPASSNAENLRLIEELDSAVAAAASDPEIKVVILGGIGRHFSAGHDTKESRRDRGHMSVEARFEHEALRYLEYSLRLRDLPKPTIAQVQGACIGGAFMLANMCDLVVAADDAYFSDPVVQSVGACAVEVLIHPWVMSARRAKEMLFTGERISAEEAFAIGMVNRVVPRDKLENVALDLANRIARAPLFSLMLTKRSLNRTADIQGQRNACLAHFDTHQLSHHSESMCELTNMSAQDLVARGRIAVAGGCRR
jgi:enoyl-CoA hydratase